MTWEIDSPTKLRAHHRAECRDCDHTWSEFTAAEVRSAAKGHVSSTGHQVIAITENRTLYSPPNYISPRNPPS